MPDPISDDAFKYAAVNLRNERIGSILIFNIGWSVSPMTE